MMAANKKTCLVIIGTRPEAIKMAPVVMACRSSALLEPVICSTGQHREMLATALSDFGLVPDHELDVMLPGQTLAGLAGRLFLALEQLFAKTRPDCILVQGDTSSVMVAAACGFFMQVPVGHIEAGLRSGDLKSPFPEEFNRRVTTLAADWHFAPTAMAIDNLRKEGISENKLFLTGNTVVDALLYMREQVNARPPQLIPALQGLIACKRPFVLVTGHRRENFGLGMENLCQAISLLANMYQNHFFVYPVHLNPNVSKVVHERLGNVSNVLLTEPCSYRQFVYLLERSAFVISDSGGIQEEATSLGKRVLVTRDLTERPEAVRSGFCTLVGTDVDRIVAEAKRCISEGDHIGRSNPFGDGRAGAKIISILENSLLPKHW